MSVCNFGISVLFLPRKWQSFPPAIKLVGLFFLLCILLRML
nr:MAG TPA: hypothetical protein [Caudoviricetes sp.]